MAEPQSEKCVSYFSRICQTISFSFELIGYFLTGLPTGLNGIKSSKRISAAGDVRVTPELRRRQLQHVLEALVAAEFAGESEASEGALVPDVGVGALQRVAERVAVHAKLVGDHHHVEHRVPVRVLGVGIGSLQQEQIVDSFVAKTSCPSKRVLSHVSQTLKRI